MSKESILLHKYSIPTPFKNMSLLISLKYLAGKTYVYSWSIYGMLVIGKRKPENRKEGIRAMISDRRTAAS